MTGAALTLYGRLMTYALVPVFIDLVTSETQFRQSLDEMVVPGGAVGMVTYCTVETLDRLVGNSGFYHLSLVRMAGKTEIPCLFVQQVMLVACMRLMALGTAAVLEGRMPAGLFTFGLQFRVALGAESCAGVNQEHILVTPVGLMTDRTLAHDKRAVETAFTHLIHNIPVASCAKTLLRLFQYSGHLALVGLVAGQAATLFHRFVIDWPGAEKILVAFCTELLSWLDQKRRLAFWWYMRLMTRQAFPPGRRGMGAPTPAFLGSGSHKFKLMAVKAKLFRRAFYQTPVISSMRYMTLRTLAFSNRWMCSLYRKLSLFPRMATVT